MTLTSSLLRSSEVWPSSSPEKFYDPVQRSSQDCVLKTCIVHDYAEAENKFTESGFVGRWRTVLTAKRSKAGSTPEGNACVVVNLTSSAARLFETQKRHVVDRGGPENTFIHATMTIGNLPFALPWHSPPHHHYILPQPQTPQLLTYAPKSSIFWHHYYLWHVPVQLLRPMD